MVDPSAAFDESRFELLYDMAESRYILFENLTEEKVDLGEGSWSLHFDDQYGPFIVNGEDEQHWCCDLVQHVVVAHPTMLGEVVVQSPSGQRQTLREFRQKHRAVSIPLSVVGRGEPAKVDAFAFTNPTSGVYVRWSLPSLHKEFMSQAGETCSRWYQNWWQWWAKFIGTFGVDPAGHLRKASWTKHTADEAEEDDCTRFLPAASLSTFALIILLSRWANPSKSSKDKNSTISASWTVCLQGVVGTFMSKGVLDLVMFLDAAVELRPSLPMNGNNMCTVRLTNGLIDMTPLVDCDEAAVVQAMACVKPFRSPTQVPLFEACLAFEQAGRRAGWLFKQLVFNIACFVESAILESLEPPPAGEAGQARAPDLPDALVLAGRAQKHQMWRAARLAHKLKICPVKINDRARRILNYFFCLRRSFSTERTVHVAFDASRVGGRNRLLGFISRPDGLGAWLPPQALSSRRNFQGTQRFYSSSGFFPKTGLHKDFLDVFWGVTQRFLPRICGTQRFFSTASSGHRSRSRMSKHTVAHKDFWFV